MRLPWQLLQRKLNAHKGDFGHVLIIAGCARFSGAAVLSAEATLRLGAGLVTLSFPESLTNAIIKIKPKEIMLLPLAETKERTLSLKSYKKIKDFVKGVDVLAIGPGLSQNKSTQALIRKVISRINKPLVIDADALNALAGHLETMQRNKTSDRRILILTPHVGEMSRLIKIGTDKIEKNKIKLALKFAQRHKITLVLKGHNTIVCDYKNNIYKNHTGNPGMSTAGSGDVLTGMIAALLAQKLNAFAAAKYAVYLHGLAGDLAAKEKTQISLIASDIIAKIPEAIKKCSKLPTPA